MVSSIKTLYIDYSKCIGCETCESVCKFLYSIPRIVLIRTIEGEMLPIYCRHCESPYCAKACKNGAITVSEDGTALLDSMRCRGCETRNCVLGCPYGGMLATHAGVGVNKCDMCQGRRLRGEEPACVEMCPCGAIQYIERNKLAEVGTATAIEAEARVFAHVRQKKM